MFGLNWVKKTGKKVEATLDKTAEGVDEVLVRTNQLIEDSRHKIEVVATLIVFGMVLGVVSNIVSIAVNTTILTIHNKNNN